MWESSLLKEEKIETETVPSNQKKKAVLGLGGSWKEAWGAENLKPGVRTQSEK